MEGSRLPVMSPTKNTGIPRSSNLPTPKPATVEVPQERPTTAKPTLPRIGSVRGKGSLQTPSKSNQSTVPHSTNKRSSILAPGFVAPRPPSSQSTRPVSPTKTPSTLRTNSRLAQRRPRPISILSSNSLEPEDANDQLGSLDSFRASSRLGRPLPSPSSADSSPFEEEVTPKPKRTSRPSLSDRTIESLSQLPSTPATDRRRSGFFNAESPMVQSPGPASSRPASAMSFGKRPTSSDGLFAKPSVRPSSPVKPTPALPKHNKRMSIDYSKPVSSRRSISASIPRPSPSVSSNKTFGASVSGGRPPKPPPTPYSGRPATVSQARVVKAPAAPTASKSLAKPNKTATTTVSKPPSKAPTPAPIAQLDHLSDTPTRPSKSSAALRETIAKAKAAKRTVAAQTTPTSTSFEGTSDIDIDPLNQRPKNNKMVLRKRIDAARADGRLNIAAMNLTEIPAEVMRMYDPEAMTESNLSWNEAVDVSRLIASDNMLDTIPDHVFPDVDPREAADIEDGPNCQFAGLEMLDLHGNRLISIPMGLCRLERLTTLNLSHNQLGNNVFDVIAKVPNLRELKLGHNNISGYLPQTFSNLKKLEVLELQSNKLLSLPEFLQELSQLRALNVSGNQLSGLPMDALESLPITDLDVSKNALVGALFPFSVSGMPKLRDLNVSNNSLASLAFSESLALPALKTLSITNNRIVSLPAVSGWQELITLAAGDNRISELPSGFTTLRNLKHADLSSNELLRLDDRIALMENLDSLLVDANPLKDRKFLSMSTENIKRQLRARLEPAEEDHDEIPKHEFEDEAIDVNSPEDSRAQLSVSASGCLDLADRELIDEDADALRSFLGANDVREMLLSRNKFTIIPFELSLAQNLRVLDMSMCALSSIFLEETIALPQLRELQLAGNKITSLDPLLSHLHAPALQHLDVSNNKLSGSLPALRQSFPALKELQACDNRIEGVTADSLRGLQTAVLARNNIVYIPPEIGMLWYEGLRALDISSNAFKVPNHATLAKGTEATLASLRNRIPGYGGDDETF